MIGKKIRFLSFLLALILLMLSGCAKDVLLPAGDDGRRIEFEYTEPVTLRLVLDEESKNVFQYQVEQMIADFTAVYDSVTIEIDWIPDRDAGNGELRDAKILELRGQIQSGEGPDLFLENPFSILSKVFPDVQEAMHLGYFADINEYYLNDAELNRAALLPVVMDAGVVNGARYVLPLRFDCRLAYVNADYLHETGLTTEDLDSGIVSLLNKVIEQNDPYVAASVPGLIGRNWLTNYLPNILDYQNREVILDQQTLIPLLQSIQNYQMHYFDVAPLVYGNSVSSYLTGDCWMMEDQRIQIGLLSSGIEQMTIAQASEVDLNMIPLCGVDGSFTADIMYYGAVGANCKYPDIAYEFLRMFLMEDVQWGVNIDRDKLDNQTREDFLRSGTVLSGYPVRISDSVSAMYAHKYDCAMEYIDVISLQKDTEFENYADNPDFQKRVEALKKVETTGDELIVLLQEIDSVRFPVYEISTGLWTIIQTMNNPNTGDATDVNLEVVANDCIHFLYTYLHGGAQTE